MAKASKPEVTTIEAEFTQHMPCHFSFDGNEYHLFKGETYTLPNCDFVKTLIAIGHLKTA
jgi:hypothetical protein